MRRQSRWLSAGVISGLVVAFLLGGLPVGSAPAANVPLSYAQTTPPTIRVAVTVGLVPWQYKDRSGRLTGFEVEMLREIARRLNRNVEFIDVEWEGIFAGLQANKYEIIASAISILCERQKILDFSVPYYDTGVSVTVRKNDRRIQQVEDLKGMILGVGGAGTTSHLWLLRHRFRYEMKDIKVYDKTVSAMLDLEVGRIDGVAENYPTATGYVKDKPVLEVRLRNLTAGKTGMAYRKGDPLVGVINPVIDAMKRDGTMARLHREQFGFEATPDAAVVKVMPTVPLPEDCR